MLHARGDKKVSLVSLAILFYLKGHNMKKRITWVDDPSQLDKPEEPPIKWEVNEPEPEDEDDDPWGHYLNEYLPNHIGE